MSRVVVGADGPAGHRRIVIDLERRVVDQVTVISLALPEEELRRLTRMEFQMEMIAILRRFGGAALAAYDRLHGQPEALPQAEGE